jgi:cobalt-precorrin 5A hydrolase/precorrin-3B C17-methyltransferase
MRVLSISVSERGRALAERLPYERVHGEAARTIRQRWSEVDAFVLVLAVGAAVRIIAPLLGGKASDPAVVCVDDAGRHVVAVLGGHAAGANGLAEEVAGILGSEPVVTTATDVTGTPALDQLPGLSAVGDVAGVTAALLDGAPVLLDRRLDWPIPAALEARTLNEGAFAARIVVTDERVVPAAGVVALHPPSLVAGIGSSTGAPPEEVASLLGGCLDELGLAAESVGVVGTIDRRASEPALVDLGKPMRLFTAAELAAVEVPTPSKVVNEAVGTPSVAEAAALLAAGAGATLLLAKRVTPHATLALARRSRPAGRIVVVGLGPGGPSQRTADAARAVRGVEVVVGFRGYVGQCADLIRPDQTVLASPIGEEVGRAREAVRLATEGRSVAVVCSGDPGVYAMASLVLEEAAGIEVAVVPGVTAALAAASRLGAPLGHDHLVLSLSDLLTPWELIVRRVEAARDADLVLALYNPRSKQRDWQLGAVRDVLLTERPPSTPVGIVTDAGRAGESVTLTTLAALDPELVGMTSCVIIGSSATTVIGGRMVTPRGYRRSPA